MKHLHLAAVSLGFLFLVACGKLGLPEVTGSPGQLGGNADARGGHLANGILPLSPGGVRNGSCRLDRFNDEITSLAFTPDSIYVGGYFLSYDGQPAGRIAKIRRADCALDTTFSPPALPGFDGYVSALTVYSGALYVGGSFTSYRGLGGGARNFAKLNLTNGEQDTRFSPAVANGFDGVPTVLLGAAGSLYAGGEFTSYSWGAAVSANRLVKIHPFTGAPDPLFSPADANGFDARVTSLATDGVSLFVGGEFTSYRGEPDSAYRIAKLDLASGALDTSFSPPGSGTNGFDASVLTLRVKGSALYVGGAFTAYRGEANSARRIAKLDRSSGALDPNFNPPSTNGFDERVQGLVEYGSSLYAVGRFRAYRGAESVRTIAKLNLDGGGLDTSFAPPSQSFRDLTNVPSGILEDGGALYPYGYFDGFED